MRASDIQQSITINQMYDLLDQLGAAPILNNENEIIAKSICHGDDRYKLYYYDNSKRFTCYTNCGSGFSVFDLLQKVLGIDFITSLNMVKDKLNIQGNSIPINQLPDMNCFKKFSGEVVCTEYEYYDERILQQFHKLYHPSWIKDNISTYAMNKYNIRFNIVDNQIIIPHYDINNNLIGVRVRNLNSEVLDRGQKYMPLFYGNGEYTHNLRGNLYGLNIVESNVRKYGKIIIFESEKACMQLETMYPDHNVAVALSGSNLTDEQADIINDLDVTEVIIALDKEFDGVNTNDEFEYARMIRKNFLSKLLAFHKVSIIWDSDNLLSEKESPSDCGKDIFEELLKNRIVISE